MKNWFQGFAFKSSENPVSNFAFKSNLNRYTKVSQLRMAAVDARHHSAAAAHVCVGALAASSSVATSTRSTCVSVSLRLASITRRADDEEPEGGNTWIGK